MREIVFADRNTVRKDHNMTADRHTSKRGVNARSDVDELNLILQTASKPEPTNVSNITRPNRRHPAHGVYESPRQTTIVYVTICCHDRRPWLATDNHHELLVDIWRDKSHWVVGRYVLMPDHLHLLASPQPSVVEFDAWATYIKSQFTQRNQDVSCVWQTDHWDTRIRNLQHYHERAWYLANNPVRAGLVAKSADWKYQGVVHEVRWD